MSLVIGAAHWPTGRRLLAWRRYEFRVYAAGHVVLATESRWTTPTRAAKRAAGMVRACRAIL